MTKEKKYSTIPASEKAPVLQEWLKEHKARDLDSFTLPEGEAQDRSEIFAERVEFLEIFREQIKVGFHLQWVA